MWETRIAILALLVAGCSSDDPAPSAPELTELVTMAGGIHVTWVNKEAACDAIEVERQSATGAQITSPFALVYTVPGAADNKHDGSAAAGSVHTYRLRCKKTDRYSVYSNELSTNL